MKTAEQMNAIAADIAAQRRLAHARAWEQQKPVIMRTVEAVIQGRADQGYKDAYLEQREFGPFATEVIRELVEYGYDCNERRPCGILYIQVDWSEGS